MATTTATPSAQSCLACGGTLLSWGRRKGYGYARCASCGSLQQSPLPTAQELHDAYTNTFVKDAAYHDDTIGIHRPIYERCVALLDRRFGGNRKATRVLDYGCGWGGLCESLAKAGYDHLGIDLSREEIASCQSRGLRCEVGDLDLLRGRGEKFDAIFAIFVFEHLVDYPRFFDACRALLKPGGMVCIAIPTASLVRFLGRLKNLVRPGTDMPGFGETIAPPWHTVVFSSHGVHHVCRANGFRLDSCDPCPKYRSKGLARNLVKGALYAAERAGMLLFGRHWPVHTGGLYVFSPDPGAAPPR